MTGSLSATEPGGFRRGRRPGYACAEAVAARLEPGTPSILDMAPAHRGYTAGIGCPGLPGPHPVRGEHVSDHPPQPGPWAVGPRPGFRGAGAKSEEILAVTGSRDPEESAFRLDDDLPRARRWTEET
ncbi:hypothetical protein [Streptomyces sp. JB150]|uniref:hypothetical protein n=1 Tax=Streptomyces sp. JB150 TaxID=2714844 RepID=UPI00140AB1FA|nr:hypothetical protein [Streptomyces sp. JB150]QIJ63551.1 hypothetical protein G7Z13_17120 [Streptomyces sp. JB150]